jgi:hypothetical protein
MPDRLTLLPSFHERREVLLHLSREEKSLQKIRESPGPGHALSSFPRTEVRG